MRAKDKENCWNDGQDQVAQRATSQIRARVWNVPEKKGNPSDEWVSMKNSMEN
jgi:hypothetical protein